MAVKLKSKESLLSDYGVITLAAMLMALNYYVFILPNQFAPSGLGGINTMIQYVFHISVGWLTLAMNIPLAVICWFTVDRQFTLKTVVSVVTFSVTLLLMQNRVINVQRFVYFTGDGRSTLLAPVVAGTINGMIEAASIGKAVSHARGNGVHAVPACGIPHQVDPVRVRVMEENHVFNQAVIHPVGIFEKMGVPDILHASCGDIDAVADFIGVILLHRDPLLVIILFRGASAAVKCNIKGIQPVLICISVDLHHILHFTAVKGNGANVHIDIDRPETVVFGHTDRRLSGCDFLHPHRIRGHFGPVRIIGGKNGILHFFGSAGGILREGRKAQACAEKACEGQGDCSKQSMFTFHHVILLRFIVIQNHSSGNSTGS